jgi:ribosome biogenesis GTPase
MRGRIVRGVGGYYFVDDGERVIMGNARGILKRNKDILYVGDYVDFELREDGDCIITGYDERRNVLNRPPVSNLDMLLVTFAAAEPEVNFYTVDKLCLGAHSAGIDIAICITKSDLRDKDGIEGLCSVYSGIYPVVPVSAVTGEGIPELSELIRGKSIAFAGPSGVGKSTLLNRLTGSVMAETGEISDKTGRGKHTTRHVEIFDIGDETYVYDTPGFTSIDVPDVSEEEIRASFPEFARYSGGCRFGDCRHINEPECAVKEALSAGNINKNRYGSYLAMIEEHSKWQK